MRGFWDALGVIVDVQACKALVNAICASLTRLSEPALGVCICEGIHPQQIAQTSLLAHWNAAARTYVCVECWLVVGPIPTRQRDAVAKARA